MKRRILSILLALALLCSLAPQLSLRSAADTYSGSCGSGLTWTLDTDTGVLRITGSGSMSNNWNSSSNYSPWYSYRSSIKTVTINSGVKNIGKYAFYRCTDLTSVTIQNSVTSIGEYAFWDCTSLTSVTIPNSVTSIGDNAFWDCTSLPSVTIPKSVTSIGNCIFIGCSSLTGIFVDEGNSNYSNDSNGVLFNKRKTALIQCPGGLQGGYTIPSSVTSIGNFAFIDCSSLTSVTIPNSVTSIGRGAFESCTSLTSVTIPNNVTSIENFTFEFCRSLMSVTIPNSVTSIGYEAFYGCNSLTSVTIPNSVTSIGHGAFNSCTGLTSVTIPNSVTSIEDRAFQWCTSLTNVTIPNSVTSIEGNVFYDCSSLTGIFVDAGNPNYSSDSAGVLFNKKKTELIQYPGGRQGSYTIPNSVTSIGNCAFVGCASLTSVTIPNSVTSIGSSAFYGCTSLTSMTIPNSVTSIGSSAFRGCTSLMGATIPNSVTSIGSAAFYDCTSLTSMTIPNSVTSIGSSAFYGCTSLTSVTIPNSVTRILGSAFYGCIGLTSVVIPKSVTQIGYRALGYYAVGYNDRPIPDLTIYGYPGSAAESYASSNGFRFLEISVANSVLPSDPNIIETVSNEYLETWANNQADAKLDLGNDIKGPSIELLGHEFPLFNYGKMGFEAKIKGISATVQADAEKKTLKIILGYSDEAKASLQNGEDNRTQYGKEYQDLKEFFKLLDGRDLSHGSTAPWNSYQKLRSKLQDKLISTDGLLGLSAKIKVVGYLELSYETGDLQVKEGGVTVIAEAGVNTHFQYGISYVELGVKGSAEVGIPLEGDENSPIGIKLAGLKGKFGLEINPCAGLGVKNLKVFGFKVDCYAEGGAHGSLNVNCDTREPSYTTVKLDADVYLEAKIGPAKGTLKRTILDWTLYPKSKDAGDPLRMDDEMEFVPIPRGYLNAPKHGRSVTGAELELNGIYPYPGQQLVPLPDGKELLVYVSDDGTKADNDRSTVFYRIGENGVWSGEQPVYESGTYMDAPQVFRSGAHTYVVWKQAARSFADETPEPQEILSACDLYLAEYIDGGFTAPVCVSGENDGIYEGAFALCADENGNLELFWSQNETDLFGASGINDIFRRSRTDGVWGDASLLFSTDELLAGLFAACVEGEPELFATLGLTQGEDEDAETILSLYRYDLQSGAMTELCDGPVEGAQLYEGLLYVVQDGLLYRLDPAAGTKLRIGPDGISDFSVVSNGSSTAILNLVTDGLRSEVYASYGMEDEWSDWEQLTEYGDFLRSVSALMNPDGSLKLAVCRVAVEEDEDGLSYAESADLIVSGKTEFLDLSAVCLNYDTENYAPNTETAFILTAQNTGNIAAQGFTLRLYDEGENLLAQEYFEDTLEAGETAELRIEYILPEQIGGMWIRAELTADGSDRNPENNSAPTRIALADLRISSLRTMPNTCIGGAYSGTVENAGYLPAENVVLNIYSDAAFTQLVNTVQIGTLAARTEYDFAFELPDTLLAVAEENTLNALYAVVTTDSEEIHLADNEEKAVFGTVDNPHSPGAELVLNETMPTCTEEGSREIVISCQLCGKELIHETVPVQPLGHDYVEGVCTRCGAVDPDYHPIPITDVPPDAYYREPVLWAIENGITNGTSETTFSPNQKCTRAQIITFLWRAAGSPPPTSEDLPFSDVYETAYYYDPVRWAYEQGITSGIAEHTFGSQKTCSRAEAVTLLWRAAGSPIVAQSTTAFTDVPDNIWFTEAVAWAVENEITAGTSETTFSPYEKCTRAQIVTFLYCAFSDNN